MRIWKRVELDESVLEADGQDLNPALQITKGDLEKIT